MSSRRVYVIVRRKYPGRENILAGRSRLRVKEIIGSARSSELVTGPVDGSFGQWRRNAKVGRTRRELWEFVFVSSLFRSFGLRFSFFFSLSNGNKCREPRGTITSSEGAVDGKSQTRCLGALYDTIFIRATIFVPSYSIAIHPSRFTLVPTVGTNIPYGH